MITPFDVPAKKLINKVAEELKKIPEITPPAWIHYVKTAPHKVRGPDSLDFWYTRCASLLRKVYVHGPTGVSRFKEVYGGRKRGTLASEHHADTGGSIIRKALQQLEKAGLLSHGKIGGRTVTAKGKTFLNKLAKEAS